VNERDKTIEAEILEEDRFSEEKPPELEPGSLPARFGALCLDVILITAVFVFLLTQVVFPEYYPGAMEELLEQFEPANEAEEQPPPSENVLEALRTSNILSLMFVFVYFSFVPVLARGGTLGMRIFNLRIEDRDRSVPAPLRAHLVRGAVKTICLQIFFPFLTLLFLFALRSRKRLAPHDLLARTRVVRGPSFSRK